MNNNDISLISQLSDQQLLAQVKLLAQRERQATVTFISHLAVLDERGLYLGEGCSSMFTYCAQVLHLSEHAAYKRIEAARAARKYPVILELLDDGSVNLTTIVLLAPHLTPENHVAVLAAAKHQRKRQVEELVASLRPRPSVPSSIRRLPARPGTLSTASSAATSAQAGPATVLGSRPDGNRPLLPPDSLPPLSSSPARRAVVEPLAPERYKVQFTATAETCEKLRLAQDLLRHQIPSGDLGEIVDRALTALLEQVAKQKLAATDRPRTSCDHERKGTRADSSTVTGTTAGSRHIPAEVRRTVWKRDGGRCAFVAHNGRRCTERALLEFHHVVPYCVGGEASVENIQLRCRAHNVYESGLAFGWDTAQFVREVAAACASAKEFAGGNSLQGELSDSLSDLWGSRQRQNHTVVEMTRRAWAEGGQPKRMAQKSLLSASPQPRDLAGSDSSCRRHELRLQCPGVWPPYAPSEGGGFHRQAEPHCSPPSHLALRPDLSSV